MRRRSRNESEAHRMTITRSPRNRMAAIALTLVCTAPASAQYTPWAEEDFPMNLYWGDTHLHSSYSVDANTMGNTGLSPAQAYRFARGETVRANNGMLARLVRHGRQPPSYPATP